MRLAVAVLVAVVALVATAGPAHAQSPRERILRALEVVDELSLDDAAIGRLFRVLSSYERERDVLVAERDAITRQLATADDPLAADKLLDDLVANQRALGDADARLVMSLRALLPAQHAARTRMILLGPPKPAPAATSCDPFSSMHGCARR